MQNVRFFSFSISYTWFFSSIHITSSCTLYKAVLLLCSIPFFLIIASSQIMYVRSRRIKLIFIAADKRKILLSRDDSRQAEKFLNITKNARKCNDERWCGVKVFNFYTRNSCRLCVCSFRFSDVYEFNINSKFKPRARNLFRWIIVIILMFRIFIAR